VLTLFVAATEQVRAQPSDQPNFLLILIDDMGREWLSCYGSEMVETPNIDRLAAQGIRFKNCYATPLCTTTRSVLLSGRYQFRTGWTWHSDPAAYGGGYFDWKREITFARLLGDAGYRTAVAGKWQINNLFQQPDAIDKHGFDEHCVWPNGQRDDPVRSKRCWDAYVIENGKGSSRAGQFGPDIYCNYLVDFMKRHRNRPFLAYHAMHLVHTPLVTTPLEREPKTGKDKRATSTAQYAAMVRYADHLVGRLLNTLEETGLRKNTVVILSTDNGSPAAVTGRAWGVDVRGGKGWLTESGINVPLIVSCPGRFRTGVVTDQLADFTDILPTMLDLADVPKPEDRVIDGRSLAPLLRGDASYRPREWIFSQYAEKRVVREKRFKLYSTGAMYDAERDVLEQNDLQASTAPEVVTAKKRLQAVLDSLPPDTKLPWEPRSQSWFRAHGMQPKK
jgi:arylsulfatase A-like enzyme